MDFLDWAEDHPLPRSLQSRAGWAAFFARRRNPSPHIHQIEPTNQCNCSCIMCPRDRYMTRDIGYMEMDSFQRLIGEISTFPDGIKAKEIELFHFGESLFHPRILDMVHCTSLAGLKPVLSVNPANFSQDQIDRLSGSGPLKIIISIDSLNPDTFKAIRGPGADLHKAVSNTETLLRKSAGNRGTEIVIRMIVMDINQDETESFRQFWQQRGIDPVFREFFPWNTAALAELGRFRKYPPHMPCPFPWQHMVVQWNGDVVPCCRDYNGTIQLGNIARSSLQDIWNGSLYEDFRRNMATGNDLPACCRECLDLYYSNSR